MITCNLMGGLGNQLFQIFATISYAIKTKQQFKFLNITLLGNKNKNTTIRYTFWNTLLYKLQPFLIDQLPQVHIIKEQNFMYNELPLNEMIYKDIMIYGYFQSYKYFKENYKIIYKLLNFNNLKTIILNKTQYTKNFLINTTSMHFRFGDYKHLQHIHPLLTQEYYIKCLSTIVENKSKKMEEKIKEMDKSKEMKEKYLEEKESKEMDKMEEIEMETILYFCQEEDIEDSLNIVEYLKTKTIFKNFQFIRADNNLTDWEQLLLMSCCHNNIIANSTFSWWAAYLNDWNDKCVYYPSIWFNPNILHNTMDLFPLDWIKI